MPLEPSPQTTVHQRLLDKAFANRRKQNSKVSMRSFAKDLDISHSYFLDLQSGRRKLTLKRALKILPKLRLTAREQHHFIESVRAGSLLESTTASNELQDVADKSIFTHWYNIGIMTLAGIPKRPVTCASIAKDLGISLAESTGAVARLASDGYLLKQDDGTYIRSPNAWDVIRLREPAENPLADQYSKQVIAIADRSIEKDSASERVFCSSIFSMSESQFALLEERMHTLCFDIMNESGQATRASSHNRVYLFAAQLVPLAKWK